jgi:DNA-binding MarR family transcriptional regulator
MSHGRAHGAPDERRNPERRARRTLDGVQSFQSPLLPGRRGNPSLPIALEGYAGFTLIVVAHAVEQRYASAMRQLGISLRDVVVLAEVARAPGVSQGALAERVGLSRSRLSEQIETLATAGYVERPISPRDLRVRRIFPTFPGQEVVEAARPRLDEVDRGWLSGIEAAGRPAFLAGLHRLAPALTNRFGGG